MTRKQSLEVLSLRVSDLLEGLDEAGEGGNGKKEDAQHQFVRFRQKLESILMPRFNEAHVRSITRTRCLY